MEAAPLPAPSTSCRVPGQAPLAPSPAVRAAPRRPSGADRGHLHLRPPPGAGFKYGTAERHRRSCYPRHRAWSTQPVAMVEAFCATWKLVDSHNFDEYMKALGRYGRAAAFYETLEFFII